jgi:hypothetical protein
VPFFVSFLGKQKRKRKKEATISFNAILKKRFGSFFIKKKRTKTLRLRSGARQNNPDSYRGNATSSLFINLLHCQYRILKAYKIFIQLDGHSMAVQ